MLVYEKKDKSPARVFLTDEQILKQKEKIIV